MLKSIPLATHSTLLIEDGKDLDLLDHFNTTILGFLLSEQDLLLKFALYIAKRIEEKKRQVLESRETLSIFCLLNVVYNSKKVCFCKAWWTYVELCKSVAKCCKSLVNFL